VNCCVPSTMHQCLVQWVGDKIEVVLGDSSYIIVSVESDTYEQTTHVRGSLGERFPQSCRLRDYTDPSSRF